MDIAGNHLTVPTRDAWVCKVCIKLYIKANENGTKKIEGETDMGRLLTKIGVKKTLIISICFTLFHLIEDFIWVTLGRYTTLSLPIIIFAIVIMGLLGGLFFRIPKVRQFLGS